MKTLDVDFSDLGGAEALAVATQAPEPTEDELIFDALADAGLSPATAFLTGQRIAEIHGRFRMADAGAALRYLASGLTGTASAVALRRVLIGSDATLEADAATVKVSKQRLHFLEQKARSRIGGLTGHCNDGRPLEKVSLK